MGPRQEDAARYADPALAAGRYRLDCLRQPERAPALAGLMLILVVAVAVACRPWHSSGACAWEHSSQPSAFLDPGPEHQAVPAADPRGSVEGCSWPVDASGLCRLSPAGAGSVDLPSLLDRAACPLPLRV